ncbi:hypothetical protein [Stratiformator vulcanicus]|uniref:Uncharacterized protein n=1 Tax=Stratiformator vulcanicus TaxID=2527980 RepID=A0A517QZV4_9PLAN|nr:hypothetical protein [Stratiformator vulcanicus]QDT37090.1 hypothetical protein Pan189_14580 [Stratiformator vulcanicus]
MARQVLDRIESILLEAESEEKPLEIEPFRGRLFELFVIADGGGFLKEDAEVDLTADGICRELGERWGLAEATAQSTANQQKLASEHVARMRLLWSMMRMWMEWDYAWKRWPEFRSE